MHNQEDEMFICLPRPAYTSPAKFHNVAVTEDLGEKGSKIKKKWTTAEIAVLHSFSLSILGLIMEETTNLEYHKAFCF